MGAPAGFDPTPCGGWRWMLRGFWGLVDVMREWGRSHPPTGDQLHQFLTLVDELQKMADNYRPHKGPNE
jgi:hypothetical protein